MKVLICGGAGFIGSHIAEQSILQNDSVRILDNLRSGHEANLAGFREAVEFRRGDIRDLETLTACAQGCEVIYHQAAIVSVPYSVEHPQETHDVNIQGTFNVLQAARKAGVRRVVFACSAAVYGDAPGLPKKETMAPSPIAPYGIEKIAGEYYGQIFTRLYGVECVSLRYFNVFGPRQDPASPYSGVISIFVNQILQTKNPTIFGDGGQSRDFVYVQDVARANLLAAQAENAPGRAYNIGRGQETTLNDLISMLSKLTKISVDPEYRSAREGDIRNSVADIRQAQTDLGFEPSVSVEQGLRELIAYQAEDN